MEITNELLAAYAEGNVTPEERKQVREYLVEHPSQLESVVMMMDRDYDLDIEKKGNEISFTGLASAPDHSCFEESYTSRSLNIPVLKCCYELDDSYLASAPAPCPPTTFNERLDDLLDDIS